MKKTLLAILVFGSVSSFASGVKNDSDVIYVHSCVQKVGDAAAAACAGVKGDSDVIYVHSCVQKVGDAAAVACGPE